MASVIHEGVQGLNTKGTVFVWNRHYENVEDDAYIPDIGLRVTINADRTGKLEVVR